VNVLIHGWHNTGKEFAATLAFGIADDSELHVCSAGLMMSMQRTVRSKRGGHSYGGQLDAYLPEPRHIPVSAAAEAPPGCEGRASGEVH
jgi:hypothetical protein